MYRYNLGIAFEEVVARHADRDALRFDSGHAVTYDRLNRHANRAARHLRHLGVGAGDVVALSGHKSEALFAFLLACLKIGAPYVVLDHHSPIERLEKILLRCAPRALYRHADPDAAWIALCDRLGVTLIPGTEASVGEAVAALDDAPLACTARVTGANPAYIMFTSGSTGFPKGAVITHANVLNLIDWSIDLFGLTCDEVLTNVNPLYFDNSVFDLYSALFSGACLVPVSREITRKPQELLRLVDETGCTSWFSVPSLLIFLTTMRALKPGVLGTIRRFIFGGEGYPKAQLKKVFDLYGGRSRFYNVYGPTECTCICSAYEVTAGDFGDLAGLPPLGRMAANFTGLILDAENRPALPGFAGELCLVGPNVGKGYYRDPERTAPVFVANPLQEGYFDRMYRTGDLVVEDPGDGLVRFVGRKDNQISHMGYRIELEEIEAAMNALPVVAQAVALHGLKRGLSQIVAVVSLREPVTEETLRADLARLIPDYMTPGRFFLQESPLPKNANGKVDRVALKAIHFPPPE